MFILPGSKATKRDKRDNKKTSEPFFQYLFQWLEETFYQTYIISYNFGAGLHGRVAATERIALLTAVVCGAAVTLLFVYCPEWLVGLFVDPTVAAARIAIDGFPLVSAAFVCFILNLTAIGYYQSVERIRPATLFRPVARYDFPRSEFYPAAPRIGCCRHLAGIGAVRSGNYGVYRRVLPVATKRDDMIPK